MTNSTTSVYTQDLLKKLLEATIHLTVAQDERDKVAESLSIYNEKFAAIIQGNQSLILDHSDPSQLRFLSTGDFKDHYQNNIAYVMGEKGSGNNTNYETKALELPKLWLKWKERKSFEGGVIFDPSTVDDPPSSYNLWKGLPLVECEDGDYSIWNDHALNNICSGNEEQHNWNLDWMAHAVQKPWEIPRVALVLRGNKGVGKGVFIQPLLDIFGQYGGIYSQPEQVLGKHNSHLSNKIIIYLDELTWGGYKKDEGILKSLITESTKQIEPKFRDVFTVQSYNRVIIASNAEWAVPASSDERRFNFINVPEHEFMYNIEPKYFKALKKQMKDEGGTAKLLYDLNRRDISKFDPMILPSGNLNRGSDIIERSFSVEQKWIHDWLINYGPDKLHLLPDSIGFEDPIKQWDLPTSTREVYTAVVFAAFKKYCKDQQKPYGEVQTSFTNKFKKMLPIIETKQGKNNNTILVLPNAKECRKYYAEKILKNPLHDWGDSVSIQSDKSAFINEVCG